MVEKEDLFAQMGKNRQKIKYKLWVFLATFVFTPAFREIDFAQKRD